MMMTMVVEKVNYIIYYNINIFLHARNRAKDGLDGNFEIFQLK